MRIMAVTQAFTFMDSCRSLKRYVSVLVMVLKEEESTMCVMHHDIYEGDTSRG